MFLSLPQSAHYESNKMIWQHAKVCIEVNNNQTPNNTLKFKIP